MAGPSWEMLSDADKKLVKKRNEAMFKKTKNPWDLTNPFPYNAEGVMIKGIKLRRKK